MNHKELVEFASKHNLSEEVIGYIIDLETDNEYYELILSGDWPSSVEILEKALAEAKSKLGKWEN